MKKYIILSVIAVIIFGAVFEVNNYNNSKDKAQIENSKNSNTASVKSNDSSGTDVNKEQANDFRLQDVSGKNVSLSDFKGKKVFLNFWATWCPPCKGEMPDIEKLYDETKNSDLVILAVNIGEDRDTVQSFLKSNNYNFNVLLDISQGTAGKYNIRGIPTSYFINKDGTVSAKKTGAMSLSEMKSYINALK
ncbi:TlpA disulfide reductase family protein [Clostridium sp. JN-9]|uniref:TlpA family protein disulfide reductase n=1 Tax=Clostridium sp. JN-9 TaxID=2507159 RepID=UPI000FFE2E4C|nr:TlpA disulfide reductase family protein [Clostridium sp. JN-9]QAT39568.1 TlpA family protein disulfide reductase [Clostridium sp. JN-9]